MARSKIRVIKEMPLEPITDRDLEALDEDDESECAEEIHEYIKQHKGEFISFEEYCKRRGISL